MLHLWHSLFFNTDILWLNKQIDSIRGIYRRSGGCCRVSGQCCRRPVVGAPPQWPRRVCPSCRGRARRTSLSDWRVKTEETRGHPHPPARPNPSAAFKRLIIIAVLWKNPPPRDQPSPPTTNPSVSAGALRACVASSNHADVHDTMGARFLPALSYSKVIVSLKTYLLPFLLSFVAIHFGHFPPLKFH